MGTQQAGSVGLPPGVQAALFDLDGVITQTAKVHAAAWKQMFDSYLKGRAERTGGVFVPFDARADYETYVDGKPRADGTRSFLESRGIRLPEGEPGDSVTAGGAAGTNETVEGLGNRKNLLVQQLIRTDGVDVYPGSVAYVRAARAAGLGTAIVSSSANTRDVLAATGLTDLFDGVVDAQVAHEQHLAGKPAPDTFVAGARLLGVPVDRSVVFEDALAGVEAGRAGGFGWVVGVDRVGHAAGLAAHGADVVVLDLADLLEPV